MGLDNGIYVKSNSRAITRDILPIGIGYPFEQDWRAGQVHICYWRKCWGLRDAIIANFYGRDNEPNEPIVLDKPSQAIELIKIITKFLDKEAWEMKGDSIWEYSEIHDILIRDILNLAFIASFMYRNPDVYLEFYDSF